MDVFFHLNLCIRNRNSDLKAACLRKPSAAAKCLCAFEFRSTACITTSTKKALLEQKRSNQSPLPIASPYCLPNVHINCELPEGILAFFLHYVFALHLKAVLCVCVGISTVASSRNPMQTLHNSYSIPTVIEPYNTNIMPTLPQNIMAPKQQPCSWIYPFNMFLVPCCFKKIV